MIPFPIQSTLNVIIPDPIPNEKIKKITSAASSAYVLYNDGRLYGRGTWKVGLGGSASSDAWVLIMSDVRNVFGGGEATGLYIITKQNKIWYGGQAERVGISGSNQILPLTDCTEYFGSLTVSNILDIQLTVGGTVLYLNTDEVYTLGKSYYGELGSAAGSTISTPQMIAQDAKMIFGGGYTAGYVTNVGVMYRGGYNGVGQLGTGSTSQPSGIVALPNFVVQDVYPMGDNTYIITTDKAVYGCGGGTHIMLGSTQRTSFTLVKGTGLDKFCTGGNGRTYFYGTLGTEGVYSAGANGSYFLGSGNTTGQSQVGTWSLGFETAPTEDVQIAPCGANGVFLLWNDVLYFTGSSSAITKTFSYDNTQFIEVTDLAQ